MAVFKAGVEKYFFAHKQGSYTTSICDFPDVMLDFSEDFS